MVSIDVVVGKGEDILGGGDSVMSDEIPPKMEEKEPFDGVVGAGFGVTSTCKLVKTS